MTEVLRSKSATLQRVADYHPSGNLGNFFAVTCVAHAARTALIDVSSSPVRVLSYRELEGQIQQAVGALQALGIARNDRAAIALPNSANFIITFLALMRVGAVPVVLNNKLSSDTLHSIVSHSRSTAIVTDLIETPIFGALAEELQIKHRLSNNGARPGWQDWAALIAMAQPSATVESMQFDEQAFQPYTAGSTGTPKGIVMTHGGMLWGIEHSSAYWPVDPESRGIVAAPLFHKNAMRGIVKPMLRGGASIVILPRFRAREYLDTVERYRVTHCGGVPAMFAELLREHDLVTTGDYSCLTSISMGSSVVSPELLSRVATVFPRATVKESYGLTEGGGPLAAPIDGRKVPRGSVGVSAPEVDVRLVDPNGTDVAEGELWVRSPYVMKGYAENPTLTRQRLHEGWLHTGDVFRKDDDGFFYFIGRTDDMFVCGGENIYPKDVEKVLLQHPGISEAMVLSLPHETKGFAPAAIVVASAGQPLSASEVQDFCAANGPSFAIPRAVLIVDKMFLSPAGKPDRIAGAHSLKTLFGTLRSRTRGRQS